MKFKLTKHFKGGGKEFYIDVPKVTEELLEEIGENTGGGHAYGYRITAKKVDKIPKDGKILEYKPVEVYKWVRK